jgi:hypothetical protein
MLARTHARTHAHLFCHISPHISHSVPLSWTNMVSTRCSGSSPSPSTAIAASSRRCWRVSSTAGLTCSRYPSAFTVDAYQFLKRICIHYDSTLFLSQQCGNLIETEGRGNGRARGWNYRLPGQVVAVGISSVIPPRSFPDLFPARLF